MNGLEVAADLASAWAENFRSDAEAQGVDSIAEDAAEAFTEFATLLRSRLPTHEPPPAAIARYVLAHPDDRAGIMSLLDCCQEWLQEAPNVERERERLLAEVKAARKKYLHPSDTATNVLMDKLRSLGYGEAVDEYLRPDLGAMMREYNSVFSPVYNPGPPLNETDFGTNYASAVTDAGR